MSRLSLFPFLKRWKEKATILYHKALKRAFNVVILLFALIFALALIGYNLITIDARTPKINVQPIDVTYNVDDFVTPLSVDASVSDGGNLTFQWYSHTENSNSNGTLIESLDATDPTFTPTQSGYYYVIVTNTNDNSTGNKTASETSDVVQIVKPYKVSFYDANLGFIATKVAGGTINTNDLNSGVTTWYKANESSPTTEHNLTANINFYAIPNVQEI
ncbi:MAG: hypothetical protein LBQ52_03180, partial [Helicobacteraceae bacterium]|nr:hypothetical protein [Helicobacteraceae bacterium]